ncbi:MAG: winged helix-turn-helix transcriptional regulator [Planctomycetes bacterium]|nr:winged helix-turn-helix transcriptional regulator [Planctomycetota bacterium]
MGRSPTGEGPVLDGLDLKAKLFRGLGDGSRLAILEVLRSGPANVSTVIERTGLSQPNASMHLACLWECGLVEREPRGVRVFYRIARPAVTRLLETAAALLETCGDRVGACRRYRGETSEGREYGPRPRRARAARGGRLRRAAARSVGPPAAGGRRTPDARARRS